MNRLGLVLLVASLVGCGAPTVCDRLPAVQSALSTKRGACAVTLTLGAASVCDLAFDSGRCSAADASGVGRIYDCYERLPSCVPGQEQSWLAQFSGCASAGSVSSTCRF